MSPIKRGMKIKLICLCGRENEVLLDPSCSPITSSQTIDHSSSKGKRFMPMTVIKPRNRARSIRQQIGVFQQNLELRNAPNRWQAYLVNFGYNKPPVLLEMPTANLTFDGHELERIKMQYSTLTGSTEELPRACACLNLKARVKKTPLKASINWRNRA